MLTNAFESISAELLGDFSSALHNNNDTKPIRLASSRVRYIFAATIRMVHIMSVQRKEIPVCAYLPTGRHYIVVAHVCLWFVLVKIEARVERSEKHEHSLLVIRFIHCIENS